MSTTILARAQEAVALADAYRALARQAVSRRIGAKDALSAAALEREQRIAHGFAWVATTVEALRAAHGWALASIVRGRFGEVERLALEIAVAEACAALGGGLPMSQSETIRPGDFGLDDAARPLRALASAIAGPDGGAAARRRLAEALASGAVIDETTGDDVLDAMRIEVRRFSDAHIAPRAHGWHLEDALIPMEVFDTLAAMGIFGLCIAPEYGGLGLGKLAMSVVSEELSRGWIAAGSLGTRSEIAGELIALAGTVEQKAQWLPKLASGATIPTAVFTEPDVGSDLASLTTRAERMPDGSWRISGAKTWITHAARADLMTLLARTGPPGGGFSGLSLFLAPKSRGGEGPAFSDAGLTGGEIPVLGYRGMKEYELSFDGFRVPAEGLLGGVEGQGFRQLMQTFEGARIQTAARAVGVARNALDLGLAYATERRQFGKPILAFPRIHDKIAMMAVETLLARELTYAAARSKDGGRRCDIEAGMAKLFAARTAWANADSSLQIHGGAGYALESPISRVLCDARILSVFEGAAEIQAQVIARGLLQAAG